MKNQYLIFTDKEVEKEYYKQMSEGKFVVLKVYHPTKLAKKRKYRLVSPIISGTRYYSGDIYTKVVNTIKGDLGIYTNDVYVEKIMKVLDIDKLNINISNYYTDSDKENRELLLKLIK